MTLDKLQQQREMQARTEQAKTQREQVEGFQGTEIGDTYTGEGKASATTQASGDYIQDGKYLNKTYSQVEFAKLNPVRVPIAFLPVSMSKNIPNISFKKGALLLDGKTFTTAGNIHIILPGFISRPDLLLTKGKNKHEIKDEYAPTPEHLVKTYLHNLSPQMMKFNIKVSGVNDKSFSSYTKGGVGRLQLGHNYFINETPHNLEETQTLNTLEPTLDCLKTFLVSIHPLITYDRDMIIKAYEWASNESIQNTQTLLDMLEETKNSDSSTKSGAK